MSKKIPLHCLVMLVGPSASGKTHISSQFNSYEIVSVDSIRNMLIGESNRSDITQTVNKLVSDIVRTKLSIGERVIVDAQHINKSERIAMASLGASLGVPVFYLIVDRPLDEKLRDAGWRSIYPNLIERSHAQFLSELDAIMCGDGVAEVIDARISTFTTVNKFSRSDFLADATSRGFAGISVIGDIHGHHTAATEAIDWARQRNYLVVFLGDLIDYGPKNIEMIDTAYSYITRGLAVNIIGNHELKISKWFDQRNSNLNHLYLSDGNKTTIKQIEQLPTDTQLKVQTKFSAIMGLGAHHWVMGDIIMAHGGVSEKMKHIQDPILKGKFGKFAMFGEFDVVDESVIHSYNWVDTLPAPTTAIVGHDIRDTHRPVVVKGRAGGTAIFMDTGSGKGGHLSVADISFNDMKVGNFFRC